MAWSLSSLLRVELLLLTLCVCSLTFGVKADTLNPSLYVSRTNASIPKKQVQYTRTEEVQAKCPKLTPREPRPEVVDRLGHFLLKQRLSLNHGYWEEAEAGSTPIVPFLQLNDTALPGNLKLASFSVKNIKDTGNNLMLKGVLGLIILDGKFPYFWYDLSQASFTMEPGRSVLTIEVEGIFQPTENEDVVCMLGCAFLPSPDGGVHFPNIQNSRGSKDLEMNCDIKIQLNYPRTFNLTSRIVRGTIQSLVSPGDRYYFAPLSLSLEGGVNAYERAPAEFVNKACPADASSELDSTVSAYNGPTSDFCEIARSYFLDSLLDIEPNWMCSGKNQNCRRIGPFSSYAEGTRYQADYKTSRARIQVQSVTFGPCSFFDEPFEESFFSLILRLLPASEDQFVASQSAGLDGQTLVAEGYWPNHTSTVCMIACKVDDASGQMDDCNYRVTLHIPLILSITQRNVLKGSISSLLAPNHSESFFPLAFYSKLLLNNRNLPYGYISALRYNYSRLEFAEAVLSKNEPESWSKLKTPWFKYPTLIGEKNVHYQSLAEDLNFHCALNPNQGQWNALNFDLVALDYYSTFVYSGFLAVADVVEPVNDTIVTKTEPTPNRREEARKYLNCSGTLDFLGKMVGGDFNKLTIFTEGFYNPLNGKMYMVGCRTIKDSWEQISQSSANLVEGMDCEIEVVLQYPTTLSAWMLNPGVKVKVHSNRPVTNEFHFEDIETETYPILYKTQREQVVSFKSFEAALSVFALSLTLLCIVSQLLYIGNRGESTPYMSLSMLGAQAMGYAIPLITGAESLLARRFDYRGDHFFRESGLVQKIEYVDKILTFMALLLLLRIFEKVWRGRRLLSGLAGNVPLERRVVVICLIIHAVGFISVMGLHSRHSQPTLETEDPTQTVGLWVMDSSFERPIATPERTWATDRIIDQPDWPGNDVGRGRVWKVLQEYTGLIEDLFLLPQVVGLCVWEVTGKPLKKSFFVGLTFLQIVPHVYDYFRPRFDSPIYANPDFDFYTDVGDFLIPALALILAVLVYCQQRWKGFLRLPRRFLYQPLGTKSNETELVSTNGRSRLPSIPEDVG